MRGSPVHIGMSACCGEGFMEGARALFSQGNSQLSHTPHQRAERRELPGFCFPCWAFTEGNVSQSLLQNVHYGTCWIRARLKQKSRKNMIYCRAWKGNIFTDGPGLYLLSHPTPKALESPTGDDLRLPFYIGQPKFRAFKATALGRHQAIWCGRMCVGVQGGGISKLLIFWASTSTHLKVESTFHKFCTHRFN